MPVVLEILNLHLDPCMFPTQESKWLGSGLGYHGGK